MAGEYGLNAHERGRRHSDDHEPVQNFSDQVMQKTIENQRIAGKLGPHDKYIDSIHQPASRTMGSGVLYSSVNLAGMKGLQDEWRQPIYDPPTLASYKGYKQKASVFSQASSM